MAKPEWGTKRQCAKCGARFYDLGSDPIVCPACGVEHVPEVILKSRAPQVEEVAKPIKAPVKEPVKEVEVAADDEDEDLEVDLDDEDDDTVLADELEDEEEEPVDVRDARGQDD